MKYFILFSILISANSFAIDFQKVTGTFDTNEKKSHQAGKDAVASAAFGTYELKDDSRSPASVENEVQPSAHVTELNGTFK